MNIEQALKLADKILYGHTGKYLSDLERRVFLGSWEGQTYEEIYPSNPQYLEKDVGYKLWKKLSAAIGERVTKKTLQGAMNRFWQQTSETQFSREIIVSTSVELAQISLLILQPKQPTQALMAQNICTVIQSLGISATCVEQHLFPPELRTIPQLDNHHLLCTIKLHFSAELLDGIDESTEIETEKLTEKH